MALLLCLGAALLNPMVGGRAEIIRLADDVRIEKLADGVWRHITIFNYGNYGRVPANGLIVTGGTNAVLVDTGWTPEQTARILDWIEGDLHKTPAWVVVTHSHVDRLGGIAEARRRHLLTVASGRTAALARAAGWPVPEKTFAGKLDLPIAPDVPLRLEYPGAGHTADNIVVWLPRQKILFGGCLVKAAQDKSPGYTRDADLDAWPGTIARLEKEFPDAEMVVPGHGDPGGRDLLRHTLELLPPAKPAR